MRQNFPKMFAGKALVLAGTILVLVVAIGYGLKQNKENQKQTRQTATHTQEKTIRLGTGEIEDKISPFFYSTKGDKTLLQLCYLNLLAMDRDGNQEAADFAKISTKKQGSAMVVTIQLKPGVKSPGGEIFCAKDLLFNYYLHMDLQYHGTDFANCSNLKGLREYWYAQSGKAVTNTQVSRLMKRPTKGYQEMLRTRLIHPVLLQEWYWMVDYYGEKQGGKLETKPGMGKRFMRLFALNQNMKTQGKSDHAIRLEIEKQYAKNPKRLDEITQMNYKPEREKLAICCLLQQKKKKVQPVAAGISGIKKVDANTISITLNSTKASQIISLCNMWLVSLAGFGQKEYYKPCQGLFGWQTGKTAGVLKKGLAKGTGCFYVAGKKNTNFILKKNPNYYKGSPKTATLVVKPQTNTLATCVFHEICNGKIDISNIWQDSTSIETIKTDKAYLVASSGGYLFSTDRINVNSLPDSMTKNYSFVNGMEQVEIN